jgi:Uma2 family endonuclease
MTTKPPPKPSITRERYYELGRQGHFDGKRVELIRGEIVEMSPIGWAHHVGVSLVSAALSRVFAAGHFTDVQQPFSVAGTKPGSEPQPDVAVIPGSPRDYTDHPTAAALIVEVADTTLTNDTTTKAELYATAGVTDYWVLDLNARQLHVFRDPQHNAALDITAYQVHDVLGPNDTVSPLAAPNSTIRVSDLLP